MSKIKITPVRKDGIWVCSEMCMESVEVCGAMCAGKCRIQDEIIGFGEPCKPANTQDENIELPFLDANTFRWRHKGDSSNG